MKSRFVDMHQLTFLLNRSRGRDIKFGVVGVNVSDVFLHG